MSELIDRVVASLDGLQEEMVRIRRDLHMHPERSFHEVRTAQVVADHQRALGLEVRTEVGGMGVVARLRGNGASPRTIAIRADFDALPITEQNDVSYASTNEGVMHACGHDAHTAIALGIASALAPVRDELPGDVVFIHQHAEEEDPGGAKAMIADGALDDVDAVLATHMENYIPVGSIWHSDSYVLASSDDFRIRIRGVGGHAAWPQDCIDAVTVASQLVLNLNLIVSRNVDPMESAVVTVGSIHAGDTTNVIAADAVIEGTVRTFNPEVRDAIEQRIRQVAHGTCTTAGAECTIEYLPGAPAVRNDPGVNQLMVRNASRFLTSDKIVEMQPNMGAEDFSFFAERVPATYFFTGSANAERGITAPYHHPEFDIDEDSLVIGAKILASTALDFLAEGIPGTGR